MATLAQSVTALHLVKRAFRKGTVAMTFFRRTEISDTDLDAIAACLTRNGG